MIWKNNSTPGNILQSFAGTFATWDQPGSIAIQDLDGKPDIVTGSNSQTISVLKNISAFGSISALCKVYNLAPNSLEKEGHGLRQRAAAKEKNISGLLPELAGRQNPAAARFSG